MMYCSNCGKLLDEHDQVCPACNTVVKPAGMTHKDNFWVIGLKIWARLLFFLAGVALAGCVFGATALGATGFFKKKEYLHHLITFSPVFIASVIIAFLTVAVLMVYLEMASDAGKVKHMLENREI